MSIRRSDQIEKSLTTHSADRVPKGKAPRELNPYHKGHLASTLCLYRGVVKFVIPEHRRYGVILDNGTTISCTIGARILSFVAYGPVECPVLFPGTEVLVAKAPEDPYGIIVCAIPELEETYSEIPESQVFRMETNFGSRNFGPKWRSAYGVTPGSWILKTHLTEIGIDLREFLLSLGGSEVKINVDALFASIGMIGDSICARTQQMNIEFGRSLLRENDLFIAHFGWGSGITADFQHFCVTADGNNFFMNGYGTVNVTSSLTLSKKIQDGYRLIFGKLNPPSVPDPPPHEIPNSLKGIDYRYYGYFDTLYPYFRVSPWQFQFSIINSIHHFVAGWRFFQLTSLRPVNIFAYNQFNVVSSKIVLAADDIEFRCRFFTIRWDSTGEGTYTNYLTMRYGYVYTDMPFISPYVRTKYLYTENCLYEEYTGISLPGEVSPVRGYDINFPQQWKNKIPADVTIEENDELFGTSF